MTVSVGILGDAKSVSWGGILGEVTRHETLWILYDEQSAAFGFIFNPDNLACKIGSIARKGHPYGVWFSNLETNLTSCALP